MTIAAYIVVALALSITNMLLFRRCAEPFPVRLTRGMATAFAVALIHTVLYWTGITIGNLLRLESTSDADIFARPNAYIALGLFIIVILKLLLPYLRREPRLPVFDLTQSKSVIAMAVATGINMLLTGLAMGFASTQSSNFHIAVWPLLILAFLFGYLGIMFGRQKVALRPRRWIIVASILLLGTAIATVVNA